MIKHIYLIINLLLILLFISNCDELTTQLEEISEADQLEAEKLAIEANEALFNDLENMMDNESCNTDEFDNIGSNIKSCIEMSTSNQKYTEALEKDPNNKDAHFGKAFMEIAITSQDPLLESTLNDWSKCFKSLNDDLERSVINNNQYKMGIPHSGKAFYNFNVLTILDYIPIITSHNQILNRNENDCPNIDTIQDLLEQAFLNRISAAIDHLDKVIGTDFVFTISPEMLGDGDQDPIHLDDTEIYLMKALMHQLRAMIYAVITYNVNVPYYDLVNEPNIDYDWSWLSQNSDLLTIRSGQENSWPNAHADLINVINSIESAWFFLKEDTNIKYDVILLENITDMDEFDEMDRDIYEFLDEARKVLNESYSITLPINEECSWGYDQFGNYFEECETKEVELTLSLKNFLTDPPQNLKNIIPSYIITTGYCEYEECDNTYDDNGVYQGYICQDISWGCPEFSWVATDCTDWKSGWDVTLGGIFPTMTQNKFFNEIMELTNEGCEEIIEFGFDF